MGARKQKYIKRDDLNPMSFYGDRSLSAVLSVAEVCYMWGWAQSTVMMHIYRGNISARLSAIGKTWLISYESVVAYKGEPTHDLVMEAYDPSEAKTRKG